jgi:hypothetical protein
MLDNLEDVDLSGDALNISYVDDFRLFQYLHSNPGLREDVHAYLYFSEGTLTNSFSQNVLPDFPLVRLQLELGLRDLIHNALFRFLSFILNMLLFYYFLRWILNLTVLIAFSSFW